jgi:hypothetical protein
VDAGVPPQGASGLPRELVVLWLLFAAVAVEITVTYARIPAVELYHVSGHGLGAGLGRALVFVDFPTALVAIAVDLLIYPWLRTALERALALCSVLLCAVVAWPGVVDQGDLHARSVNAVPAIGVAIALALTAVAARRHGLASFRRAGLVWRVVAAVAALLVAAPWLAADLGFFLDRVPLLGRLFLTGSLRTQPGDPMLHPAVHHGHHHGMDGTLLVLTVLVLAPSVAAVAGARRQVLSAYLALMGCYGAGNIVNDAWLEQVVKRGWTSRQVPGVTTPAANWGWCAILLAALMIWLVWRRCWSPGPALA